MAPCVGALMGLVCIRFAFCVVEVLAHLEMNASPFLCDVQSDRESEDAVQSDRDVAWLLLELAIPQFTMDNVNQARTYGFYETENPDTIKKRVSIANKYIEQGLTTKHAWFKAFQEVPRVYIDKA